MTVQEYAAKKGISERTVYRMIERGDITAEKWQDRWRITEESGTPDKNDNRDGQYVSHLQQHIQQLQTENEYLRKELSQTNKSLADANQRLDKAQERHDETQQQSNMIIMQLTKQLENQNHMLEDMRNRSLWTRIKTAFSFASS